jgi:hypothetical protein
MKAIQEFTIATYTHTPPKKKKKPTKNKFNLGSKDLYNENCKTLMKETEEDTKR